MIKEVGLKRIIKYLIFGFWDLIFRLLPWSPLRVWWLRIGGAKIGQNCFVDRITLFNLDRTGLSGLNIGQFCYLGPQVALDLAGKITLKDHVTISANTIILSHHSVGFQKHPLLRHYPKKTNHTQLNAGSVVGINSSILPGVIIGQASMIGAGAVVTKSIPKKKLAVGIPAKVVKSLP